MPKDVIKIDKFHGGQNNSADPRDILSNEQEFLQNVHVDNIGKITNMGASVRDITKTEATGTPIPGYGLATYNSGWGFTPVSGMLAAHTTPTYGTDGVQATGIIDFSEQPSNTQGGNIIRPTSVSSVDGDATITRADSDWNCIVLGIFLQKWTPTDATGVDYTPAGNPIPLFGTGSSSDFKLASESSYTTGTLPNGATYTGSKYRMPWNVTTFNAAGSTDGTDYNETYNQELNGIPGTGAALDYGRNNFLVICDLKDVDNFEGHPMSYEFDSNFSSVNNINLVYGVGTADNLTDAIVAAINENKDFSGFEAEEVGGGIRIFETTASGACYTLCSTFQRDDDQIATIANIEDGDNVWEDATNGTNYQGGIFNLWADDSMQGEICTDTIVPDLVMVAGMSGHDRAPTDHDSWKGALNWWMDYFDDIDEPTYGETPTVATVKSHFLGEDGNEDTWASLSQIGLGQGSPKIAQVEQVVFSGTAAAGNAWTIDINGTEHLQVYGDAGNTATNWANHFNGDIDGGAQGSAVDAEDSSGTLTVTSTTAGTAGNFSFSIYPTGSTGVTRVDDERIAFINNAAKLQIHSEDIGGWVNDTSLNNIGWSSASSAKPIMYAEGGALRLSDGTFASNNLPKVVQYFETGNLCGIANDIIVGHEIMSQDLSWKDAYTIDYEGGGTATTGLIRSANYDDANDFNGSGTDWMNASYLTKNRWKFAFEVSSNEGDWSGKHKFYASAVYSDGSESLPTHDFTNTDTDPLASFIDAAGTVSTPWDFENNSSLKIRQLCHPPTATETAGGDWIFDSRMIGIRLWHSKEEDNYSIYYHVGMVHFTDGFLNHSGIQIYPWRASTTESALNTCTGTADSTSGATDYVHIISTDEDDTFENRIGYDSSSKSLTAAYQHATITGRRVWIAGVKYTDEAGANRVYNDRMIASPVNMFDVFPTPYNIIDVDTSDGDVITGLKSAHGRLLQFKNKAMYIINVADSDLQTAFLESTHKYRGVSKPYHIIDIANGIAWANKFGVFKYEGDDVVDLMISSTEDTQRLLDLNTWQDFFSDNAIIAYAPLDNLLLIKRNIDASAETGAAEADVYVFEFNTGSWTTGKERLVKNKDCTNFITLKDGTLVTMVFGSSGLDGNPGNPS